MISASSTVRAVERDGIANLIRIHIARNSLGTVSQFSDCIIHLGLVGGVEVIPSARAICTVQRDSVRILGWEDTTCRAFLTIPQVMNSVIYFLGIGGIEMICGARAVGTKEWDCL